MLTLLSNKNLCISIIGDATDPRCHGGIPYSFLVAGQNAGFVNGGLNLDLDWTRWPRRIWNLKRTLMGKKSGGYQYSHEFLEAAESCLPQGSFAGEIISFSQHFPRAETVRSAGGRISYYLDATAAQLTSGRGLNVRIGDDLRKKLLETERQNYQLAEHLVFWSQWAAESAINECGANPSEVHVILPGANVDIPKGWIKKKLMGQPGKDRPFVLGFVGKDWRRKGLLTVCEIRDELETRGWKVSVKCAGNAPRELANRSGVEFAGYIDKSKDPTAYPNFLSKCDVGCLFSTREALGLSVLEFLRVGVPVAGYAVEGPAETIPPDAGFRFQPTDTIQSMADRFEEYLNDESQQQSFCDAAEKWSPLMTWDRCIEDFQELWTTGKVSRVVRPEDGCCN